MTFDPNDYDALQWALDTLEGNGEPYEDELVDGLAVLRALNEHGDLRPNRGQRCYEFDGVASRVQCPTAVQEALDPREGDITVSMRFTITDSSLVKMCIGSTTVDGLAGFGISNSNTEIRMDFGDNNPSVVGKGGLHVVADGTAYWVVCSWDLATRTARMWLNEIEATVPAGSARTSSAGCFIGARNNGALIWPGKIWAVEIFDQTLTPDEIEAGTPIHKFNMNEEASDLTLDSSGQKAHGLIENATLADLHAVDSGVLVNDANSDGYTLGRNAIAWSEDFTNALWTKRDDIIITPDDTIAPDGSLTADLITEMSHSSDLFQLLNLTGTLLHLNAAYLPSCWIKRVTTDRSVNLSNPSSGSPGGHWQIDLSLLSDDWEFITQSHPAVTVINRFVMNGNLGGLIFAREGASDPRISFHLWGVQLEFTTSSTPGTYQRTESSLLDVIIPQDASQPTLDALLGEPLDYTGLAPLSIATQTPIPAFDGVAANISLDNQTTNLDVDWRVDCEFIYTRDDVNGGFIGTRATGAHPAPYWSFVILGGGDVRLICTDNTGALVLIDTPAAMDKWHTTSIRYTAATGTFELIVDGVSAGTTSYVNLPVSATNDPIIVGVQAQRLLGSVRNVLVYDATQTLVSQYPLDNGSGNRVHNVIANRQHGVVVNANLATFWANRIDFARDHGIEYGGRNTATFDGNGVSASKHVSLPSVIVDGDAFTFFGRIKPHTTGQGNYYYVGDGVGNGFRFSTQTGLHPLTWFSGFMANETITSTLNVLDYDDEWVDIGVIFNAGSVTFMLGDATETIVGTSPTFNTVLPPQGLYGIGNFADFTGQAARTTIWQEARTLADFAAWRAGTLDASTAKGDWEFDDNRGSLIRDANGNNDGTLIDEGSAQFWQFVPGLLDGSSAADGNPITLLPTHFNNNASEIVYDSWGAPELVGLNLPALSPPGELLRNVDPQDTKYRSETGTQLAGIGQFDGVDDMVLHGVNPQVSAGTDPYSVELWCTTPTLEGAILGMESSNLGFYASLSTDIAQIYVRFYCGGNTEGVDWVMLTIVKPTNPEQWHHNVITFDGLTVKYYRDGVLLGSETLSAPLQWPFDCIAGSRRSSTANRPFAGEMAKYRIYRAALTSDEVLDAYQNGSTFDDLLCKYDYTDQAGETLTDSSGNANDGILVNVVDPTAWWGTAYLDGQAFSDGDDRVFNLPLGNAPAVDSQQMALVIGYIERQTQLPASLAGPVTHIVQSVKT